VFVRWMVGDLQSAFSLRAPTALSYISRDHRSNDMTTHYVSSSSSSRGSIVLITSSFPRPAHCYPPSWFENCRLSDMRMLSAAHHAERGARSCAAAELGKCSLMPQAYKSLGSWIPFSSSTFLQYNNLILCLTIFLGQHVMISKIQPARTRL
jgi:hypothetical protein